MHHQTPPILTMTKKARRKSKLVAAGLEIFKLQFSKRLRGMLRLQLVSSNLNKQIEALILKLSYSPLEFRRGAVK